MRGGGAGLPASTLTATRVVCSVSRLVCCCRCYCDVVMNVFRMNKRRTLTLLLLLMLAAVCSLVILYGNHGDGTLSLSDDFDLTYDGSRVLRSRLNLFHRKQGSDDVETAILAPRSGSDDDDAGGLQYDPVLRDKERYLREYAGEEAEEEEDYPVDPPSNERYERQYDANNDIVADYYDGDDDDDDDDDDDADDDNDNPVFREGAFDAVEPKRNESTAPPNGEKWRPLAPPPDEGGRATLKNNSNRKDVAEHRKDGKVTRQRQLAGMSSRTQATNTNAHAVPSVDSNGTHTTLNRVKHYDTRNHGASVNLAAQDSNHGASVNLAAQGSNHGANVNLAAQGSNDAANVNLAAQGSNHGANVNLAAQGSNDGANVNLAAQGSNHGASVNLAAQGSNHAANVNLAAQGSNHGAHRGPASQGSAPSNSSLAQINPAFFQKAIKKLSLREEARESLRRMREKKPADEGRVAATDDIVTDQIFWSRRIEEHKPEGITDEFLLHYKRALNATYAKISQPPSWNKCGRPKNRFIIMQSGVSVCARYRAPHTYLVYGEALSFHLARLLGITNVPIVTLSRVNATLPLWRHLGAKMLKESEWEEGATVALIQWISDLERVRMPAPLLYALEHNQTISAGSAALAAMDLPQLVSLLQWSDMFVFDYITGNYDRFASMQDAADKEASPSLLSRDVHNMARRYGDGGLWFIDNESGLLDAYSLLFLGSDDVGSRRFQHFHARALGTLCVFRRSTVAAVVRLHRSARPADAFRKYVRRREPHYAEMAPVLDSYKFDVRFANRIRDVYERFDACRLRS